MAKRPILVPTDFSKVGDTALNHAIKIAQTADTQVFLSHIVENISGLDGAREKLEKVKKAALDRYNFEVQILARVGNFKEDIGAQAAEIDAALVVMGTKGLRGLQWITGGWALRIVTNSNRPFLIVQNKEIGEHGYDDIVVPLDLHKETKQKLSLVADAASYFESKVHIISPGEKDEFLQNKLQRNMAYASNFFKDKGIEHTTKVSESSSKDFDDALIEYAIEINADLISVMNIQGNSLLNLLGNNYVQNIITNKAEIPVLVLNPKETTHVSIFGAYLGG